MILEEAIRQIRFSSEHLRTVLNISHTHGQLLGYSNTRLKPFAISVQQFNILRILRGQQGKAISVREISVRMLDKMSNTSRLIEKLRIKGLLERRECPKDRRKAEIELTDKGLALINEASVILDEALIGRIQILDQEEVRTLNKILDKLNQ